MVEGYYILGTFLVVTLAVGLWTGRNVRTMKDYALANRSLGVGVLTMTLLATFIAQGDLYEANYVFLRHEHVGFIYACFLPVSFLFVAYVIAPRLAQFKGCLTMGDIMGQIYGRRVQILTGLISFVFCCLAISANLRVLKVLLPQILGIGPELKDWFFLFAAGIVVLYACFGGMRSIAITDVIQFMAAVLVVSLLARFVLYEVEGFKGFYTSWKTHCSNKVTFFSKISFLNAFCWAGFPAILLSPPYLQRMLMAQNKKQLKAMFQASLAIVLALWISVAGIIALGAVILDSTQRIEHKSGLVIVSLINSFFEDRPFIAGLMGAGLVAILMSTIDSFLHAGALAMTNDVLKPLFGGRRWHVYEILYTKLGCFVLGFLSILLVRIFSNPSDSFVYGVVPLSATTIPLIMGILDFKVDARAFFIAFGAGLLTFLGILLLPLLISSGGVNKYIHWLVAISVHTLVFLVATYRNHGGLIRKPSGGPKGTIRHIPEGWVQPQVTPTSTSGLARIAQERVRRFGYEPSLTGLFLIVTYLLPFVSSYTDDPQKGTGFLLFGIGLHLVGMSLCLMLLVQHYWPKQLQPYFALFWYCTLLYCIPFCTVLLFLREPSNPMISVHLAVHILLLISLVDWKSFVLLSGLGTALALLAHALTYGQVTLVFVPVADTHIDAMFRMGYAVIAALVIGYLFAYRREHYQENRLSNAKMVSGGLGHEVRNYLQLGLSAGESIKRYTEAKEPAKADETSVPIPKSFHDFLKEIGPELSGQAQRTGELVTKFTDVLQKDIAWCTPEPYSLRDGIKQALGTAYLRRPEVKAGLVLRLRDDFSVGLPSNFLEHIVVNLVKNAYVHGEATQVTLRLDSQARTLSVEDNGKGIPKAKIKHVFDLFYTSGKSSGIGLGLTLVQDLIQRCGGNICCVSKQGKDAHTTFILTFPELQD